MGKVFKTVEEIQVDGVRFVDARYDLQNKQFGKQSFEAGHAPGAVYVDLEQDLSDMESENGTVIRCRVRKSLRLSFKN